MISERDMEDQIAAEPERFIGEAGLTLISRQLRIGSYIFDLLFQDRHGAKLIVEVQKGTLDRNHTYKVLDYYDEYKRQNPTDFVEVMVIANQISAERKQRLRDRSVEYREVPLSQFVPPSAEVQPKESAALPCKSEVPTVAEAPSEPPARPANYHFQSKGKSGFIAAVREAITSSPASEQWRTSGDSSLIAMHVAATNMITAKLGKGLKVQLWMERPSAGKGMIKLEVAPQGSGLPVVTREAIAASIRTSLQRQGLPEDYQLATGSTIVRCALRLPRLIGVPDDTPQNARLYPAELIRAVAFSLYVQDVLRTWLATMSPGAWQSLSRG